MPKGKDLNKCLNFTGLPEDESFIDCRVCTILDGELYFKNGKLVEVHCTHRRMHEPPPNLPLKRAGKPVGGVRDSEEHLITPDNGWCLGK